MSTEAADDDVRWSLVARMGSKAGGSSMLQVQKLGTNAGVRNDTTAG